MLEEGATGKLCSETLYTNHQGVQLDVSSLYEAKITRDLSSLDRGNMLLLTPSDLKGA